MEVSRYCFPIPDLMLDCKGSGGVISSRAADVAPPIGISGSGRASGKGETRGNDLDLPQVLE
jgi:hypothetical protein